MRKSGRMFSVKAFIAVLVLISGAVAWSAPPEGLDGLVAPGAEVEKLAVGFSFTEGPACGPDGDIYFTDIPANRVLKWDVSEEQVGTVRENSGGANGLYFDAEGNLVACEGGNRQLTLTTPEGETKVLADSYDGKKLNSPNDLWIDPQGGIYFSDPRYGSQDDLQQDGFHVYYLKPDHETLVRVIDNLEKPNGLIGTKDGKTLYVADAGAGKTYVYRIAGDGTLSDRKLIAESGSDGMTLDENGNLYLTSGGILIYSSAGEHLGTVEVPERPSNVCFGAPGTKKLYITARQGFYCLPMQVDGH